MNDYVECATQADVDRATGNGDFAIVRDGFFYASRGSVTAYGSASVTAYGSASVRAYDSASVRAYDSASVTAYGSASVRAYDSASVTAYGSASVRASKYVAVHSHQRGGRRPSIDGGVLIEVPVITTAAEWCEYYGVEEVSTGVVVLFKAVRDDYVSRMGADYSPGNTPEAPDWDGGAQECGYGLHFSPRPVLAARFDTEATRYVACPVALDSIAVHGDGSYPDKVKAPRVVAPGCWEVDFDGERLVAEEVAS